ncbi:Phosphatidylinositol 3,4,5-trisphosphate 3-phosphatase TPTE2 [Olea europaea subsp. europaea]|uniref:Phosphatidylinositol 3,4,5-trisphosphate 3-phosphatase TPTE2 n=1 Tax=Olea europaea subsp. europaea TaxID=158383 RepID=A0A8S0V6E9_OLEEU|nr:Phosphatidylinositol 3,4,5-trisphosphate 3-phosphatase TPTE2 [Olea europaea subsp. europaea]
MYSWLKEDIVNVVVVHCKTGMARTGLMICRLLLFLKFFPTAEECNEGFWLTSVCVDLGRYFVGIRSMEMLSYCIFV